jgi:hypothetical protein
MLCPECPPYLFSLPTIQLFPLTLHYDERERNKQRSLRTIFLGPIGDQFPAGAMMGFFLFATASRQVLGPTKSHIEWELGHLPRG